MALLPVFLCVQVFAQRNISGVVTDADNKTIPGVRIAVQGTALGAATDLQGNYSLDVPDGYNTLVFSYVGMKTQEVEIGSSNTLNVTMAIDALGLDEVVVTAIGIPREKKALGYAVSEVGGTTLQNSGEGNLVSALSGKVAGVDIRQSGGAPGASSYIKIRGNSSLVGANQPLFIVDGVPIDNSHDYSGNPDDLSNNLLFGVAHSNRAIDINPDDIASVTILKGPAATALYGIRAANGAVVITTKKGTASTGKAVNVSYNASIGFNTITMLPDFNDTYAQGSYLFTTGNPDSPQWLGPHTGWFGSWGPKISDLEFDGSDYDFDNGGRLVPKGTGNGQAARVYDNQGSFYQTGVTFNNTVALSGGNANSNYYLSAGYFSDKGVTPNSDFKRYSLRIAGETALSDKWKTSGSVVYSKSGGTRIQQGSNTSGLNLGLFRTTPSFDNANGLSDPVNDPSSYTLADGSQRNYRGGGGYDNPYWTVNNAPFNDDVNRMIGTFQVSVDPVEWLNILYRLGTDFYADRRVQGFEIGSRTLTAGQVFNDNHFNLDFNSDIMATATRQFSDDLRGSLIVGQNMFSTFHQQLYTQGDGLTIPGFFHISNAQAVLSREGIDRKRTAAIYADARIAFRNYLYLSVTGRNEWSTSLPEGANSFFFPSTSLGFVFTEVLGLADNNVFPYGKLRLSYAQVGNDAPIYGTTNYFTQASYGDGWTSGVFFPYSGVGGFQTFSVLGNPDLKPEKTSSIEVGADLRFFNNRVGLDVTYYNSTSKDQILGVPISAATGYRTFVQNVGTVENKGFEIQLNLTPLQLDNGFEWDMTVNFTRNENMVVELAEGIENIFLNGFTGTSSRVVEGQPYGVIMGGAWQRANDPTGTMFVDSLPYNPTGALIIDDAGDPNTNGNYGFPLVDPDVQVLGDPNPDWTMGIRNTFSWKGLSLSGLIDIKEGGDMWGGTVGAMAFFGMWGGTAMEGADGNRGIERVWDGVKASNGATNDIQVKEDEAWYVNGNGSGFGAVDEEYVFETSYIRLREITLAYQLPESILGSTPFASIEAFVSGRNWWISTDYPSMDPDNNLTGASNGFGLEYFQMPGTKSTTVGLRATL